MYTVDILMVTYNHQDYISEAIHGVIKQKTNFDFRLLIFDDCSTDDTEHKVRECLSHSNPRLTILYHRNSINLGASKNGKQSHEHVVAKYTALCEGDDYWTNEFKLQKQVDFLEKNNNYSLCFHQVFQQNDKYKQLYTHKDKNIFSTEDLFEEHFIATCSILFRSSVRIPDWITDCQSGDIVILILSSLEGDLFFMDEVMGVYRDHVGGLSKSHGGFNKVFGAIEIKFLLKQHSNKIKKEWLLSSLKYEVETHLFQPYKADLYFMKKDEVLKEIYTKKLLKELLIRFKIKFLNYKRK